MLGSRDNDRRPETRRSGNSSPIDTPRIVSETWRQNLLDGPGGTQGPRDATRPRRGLMTDSFADSRTTSSTTAATFSSERFPCSAPP